MYLKTLGDLSLEGHDFKQSRPLLLLTYLCVEGSQDRRRLAELFWPSSKNALSNLTTVLSRLNKLDDSLVQVDGQQLSSPLSCDTIDLLAANAENDYLRVITLHKARFLESFYLKDMGEELEEWLYATRELIATKVRLARLTRAEQKATKGLFQEAALEAEQAYLQAGASEPSETDLERIYNLLIAGESGLAQEVNKEAQSYGLLLSKNTQECRQQFTGSSLEFSTPVAIKNSARPKKHNLPKQPSSFVGRVQELKDLKEQLSKGEAQLITLLASGGMGKTRLSLKVAEEFLQTELFSDGVFFVPLAPVNSHELVVQSIVEALDFTLTGTLAPEEQVINQIENLEALIVLDNFEHVLDSTAFVSSLLKAAHKLKILITSRERLHIPEEWVYDLWGLSKEENNASEKPFLDALNLFEQRAKQVKSSFDLNANHDHAFEICSLVEGMPLGIELAASWTNTISVKDIAQEIKESSSFLETDSRVFPERHRSLMNVMDYSWARLSEKEKDVFKKLSLFTGGFDYAAAKQISAASAKDLASLTNKALIRLNDERYEIHELLRQFAYEKLAEDSAELQASEQKHAVYFADFMHKQKIDIRGPNQLEVLKAIGADLDNILLSWDWAVEHDNIQLINKIFDSLQEYCERQTKQHLGTIAFEKVLPQYRQLASQSKDNSLKLSFAKFLSRYLILSIRSKSSAFNYALTNELEEYELLLESLDPLEYAIVIALKVYIENGFSEENSKLLEKAKQLSLKSNSPRYFGLICMIHAEKLWLQGKYRESKELSQESLLSFEEVGDQRFVAFSLNYIARACIGLGAFEEAKKFLHRSLTIRQTFNEPMSICLVYIDLGEVETRLGNYDSATRYLDDAFSLAKQTQGMTLMANIYTPYGELALSQLKYDEARRWFEKILAFKQSQWGLYHLSPVFNYLAYISLLNKDIPQAESYLKQGKDINDGMNNLSRQAQSLVYMGYLELQKHPDELKNVRAYYLQALELTQTMSAAPQALSILLDWAALKDCEQVTELLSLVKHDARSEFSVKEKARHRLNGFRGSEGFNEAIERGKKLELWSVVSSLVSKAYN